MATRNWSGAGGNTNWSTVGNWDTLPITGDTIVFPNVTNQTINLDVNITVAGVTFNAPDAYILNTSSAKTLTIGGNFTQSGAGTVVIGAAINLGAATRTFDGAGTGQMTINGLISNGGITKSSSGTLVFAGANSFASGIAINAGILSITDDSNLGSSTGAINFGGGTLLVTGTSATDSQRVFTINAGGGTINVATGQTFSIGNTSTVLGQLAGTGQLTVCSSWSDGFLGTLILKNPCAGARTGVTTVVNGGTLRMLVQNAFNTSGGTQTFLNNAVWEMAGTFTCGRNVNFTGGNSVSPTIRVTGGNQVVLSGGSGYVIAGTPAVVTIETTVATDTVNITSVISGAGSIVKTGLGALTLTAANSYTGTTTINAGTVKLGAAGGGTNTPLGTTAGETIVAATGATLDLNGFTLGTAEPLTLNGTGISNGGALSNSSGTAVTWSGLITLGSAASIIANAGNIVISNAGTILGSGFGLTLGGTNTVSSLASIIGTGAGTLTKIGSGTWTLSGVSTFTGGTTISAGTIKLGATGSGANSPLGTIANGIIVAATDAALDLNGFTLAIAKPLTLNGTGISNGGALKNGTAAAVSWSGLITLGSASSIIATAGNISITNVGTILGATFGLTIGGAFNTAITSIIGTTTGTLTKQDAGILTLSNENTFTGGTTLTAGQININSSGALGLGTFTINGGVIDVTAASDIGIVNPITIGASFTFTGTQNLIQQTGVITLTTTPTITVTAKALTLGGVISGVQGLTKAGTGTLTFTGTSANTYTGVTTVNDGTLYLSKTLMTAIPGNLTIGDGVGAAASAIVLIGGDNEISTSATVTMLSDGKLDLTLFSVGISFTLNMTRDAGNHRPAGAMTTNEIAGVIQLPFWNNIDLGGVAGQYPPVTQDYPGPWVDSQNHSYAGVGFNIVLEGSWGTLGPPAYPSVWANDYKMMRNYAESGSLFMDKTKISTLVMTLTGIPFLTYDVYIYCGQDDPRDSGGTFSITTSPAASITYNDATVFEGTYTVVTTATSPATGNCVKFTGRTESTLVINGDAQAIGGSAYRLGVFGVQLIGTRGAYQTLAALNGSGTVSIGAVGMLTVGYGSYSGVISGLGGLTKNTNGTFTISGINTFTGPTTVSAGTLLINGVQTGVSAITVKSGATLGGTGTVAGPVTVNDNGSILQFISGGVFDFSNNAYNGVPSNLPTWEDTFLSYSRRLGQ